MWIRIFYFNLMFFLIYSCFYFIEKTKLRILEWNLILKLIGKLLFFFYMRNSWQTCNKWASILPTFFCNLDFLIVFFFSLSYSLKWTFQSSLWCGVVFYFDISSLNTTLHCILRILQYLLYAYKMNLAYQPRFLCF